MNWKCRDTRANVSPSDIGKRRISLIFRMTLDALKHRNISEIDRMFERLVSLVTGLAFAIREATKVDRMLYRNRYQSG